MREAGWRRPAAVAGAVAAGAVVGVVAAPAGAAAPTPLPPAIRDTYPAAWARLGCATPEREPLLARSRPCRDFDWGAPTALLAVPAGQESCYVRGDDGALWQTCDPLGYSYRNCTSYVAWRLREDGVPASALRWLGDAGSWAADVPADLVDGSPARGAAAVLVGAPGHVSYVERVLADGAVVVSEYNKFGSGGFDGGRRIAAPFARRLRYVHFERIAGAPERALEPADEGGS